ncbi:hypothetical protein AAULR_09695, partial [Lacticaseibacillus rhamnosus MTCC 5462]
MLAAGTQTPVTTYPVFPGYSQRVTTNDYVTETVPCCHSA